MSSGLRKHIAAAINQLEPVEVYELNRWLNKPFVESRRIEDFQPYVERHLNLDFLFDIPEHENLFSSNSGGKDKEGLHSPPANPKVVPRFFSMAYPENEEVDFKCLKTIIFDLGREHIFFSPDDSTVKTDKNINPLQINFRDDYFKTVTRMIELLNHEITVTNLQLDFYLPQTEDLLSVFTPRVMRIDLLNSSQTLNDNSTTVVADKDLFSEFHEPDTTLLPNLNIRKDNVILEYTNLQFENSPLFTVNIPDTSTTEKIVNPIHDITSGSDPITKILEPVFKLSKELKNEILINLPSYQRTGAKFLFTSNFAFLYDQYELGKEVQAIMALKMLLRTRAVKNALIITSNEKEYITFFWGNEKLEGIWQTNLSLLLPDFAFNFYTSYNKFDLEKEQQSIITGLTYDVLKKAVQNNRFDTGYFSKYDAVIIDDTTADLIKQKSFHSLLKNIATKYLWFLSDYNNEKLANTIQNLDLDRTLKCLGRNRNSVHKLKRINYDFFLPLDEANIKVCKDHFDVGRDHLDDVMGLGNIFRFRPNVFKIIQDEQRQLNFVGNTGQSKKTELLLYHLSRIFNQEKRVLIYTQYEEAGLKQLSKLLQENNFTCTTFTTSDTENTIKDKLQFCESFDDKHVLITNLKPNAIRFNFPEVFYLINYDNWWNPVTRWQLETKFENIPNDLTVFNYYYNETIESKTEIKLQTKGLKEKLLLSSTKADSIYSYFDESDWCEIFNIDSEHFPVKVKEDITINNMKSLVENTKKVLTAFSFSDMEIRANIRDNSFDLTANTNYEGAVSSVLAKCFFAEHLTSDFINNQLKQFAKDNNHTSFMVVTNGSISRTNIILPANTVLIDGQRLINYLQVINAG